MVLARGRAGYFRKTLLGDGAFGRRSPSIPERVSEPDGLPAGRGLLDQVPEVFSKGLFRDAPQLGRLLDCDAATQFQFQRQDCAVVTWRRHCVASSSRVLRLFCGESGAHIFITADAGRSRTVRSKAVLRE